MSGREAEAERPARRRRSDGERSRNAILQEAAQLATVEGIDGLSIGRLADAVGMSKSGLYAHFGSKEELIRQMVVDGAAVLDERRRHQPIAVRVEMVEQRATQRLDPRCLGGQHVLDCFGQQPFTHSGS